jgi:hypothetical protein
MVELIIRVSDYLLEADDQLRRKVRRAMGGEVLELWRERAERLEREAEQRGTARLSSGTEGRPTPPPSATALDGRWVGVVAGGGGASVSSAPGDSDPSYTCEK